MSPELRAAGFKRWEDEQVAAFDAIVQYFATHPPPKQKPRSDRGIERKQPNRATAAPWQQRRAKYLAERGA